MRSVPAFALAALLLGCSGAGSPPGPASPDARLATDLPPAALRVGEGLYQEPVGYDAEGCLVYRLFSPTTMVTHSVSYRSVDGGFTLKRKHALCTPLAIEG